MNGFFNSVPQTGTTTCSWEAVICSWPRVNQFVGASCNSLLNIFEAHSCCQALVWCWSFCLLQDHDVSKVSKVNPSSCCKAKRNNATNILGGRKKSSQKRMHRVSSKHRRKIQDLLAKCKHITTTPCNEGILTKQTVCFNSPMSSQSNAHHLPIMLSMVMPMSQWNLHCRSRWKAQNIEGTRKNTHSNATKPRKNATTQRQCEQCSKGACVRIAKGHLLDLLRTNRAAHSSCAETIIDLQKLVFKCV